MTSKSMQSFKDSPPATVNCLGKTHRDDSSARRSKKCSTLTKAENTKDQTKGLEVKRKNKRLQECQEAKVLTESKVLALAQQVSPLCSIGFLVDCSGGSENSLRDSNSGFIPKRRLEPLRALAVLEGLAKPSAKHLKTPKLSLVETADPNCACAGRFA